MYICSFSHLPMSFSIRLSDISWKEGSHQVWIQDNTKCQLTSGPLYPQSPCLVDSEVWKLMKELGEGFSICSMPSLLSPGDISTLNRNNLVPSDPLPEGIFSTRFLAFDLFAYMPAPLWVYGNFSLFSHCQPHVLWYLKNRLLMIICFFIIDVFKEREERAKCMKYDHNPILHVLFWEFFTSDSKAER